MAITKVNGSVPKDNEEVSLNIQDNYIDELKRYIAKLKLSMNAKDLAKAEAKYYSMQRSANENNLMLRHDRELFILALKIECMESSIVKGF